MQESEPKSHHGSNDETGSVKPATSPSSSKVDPPTIVTGSVGSGSGSSNARKFSPVPVLPLPLPGERLDGYELEKSIGVGGMGAVFLAIDTRLQREVALKILPPEQALDPEVIQRFYQEGRAAARLDHENIARVFTIGSDKGYHFIAFEYIEGTTLRQKVAADGPLTVGDAINYTLQIAGALVHAAERKVVHRDIKPSNIIITPQGRAKLVDMGLARRFERGASDDGLTQSGMTLGTFDYISPEQARDPRDVDVRGDLYSLGCTLFHMLTGRPPFPDGTVLQKLLQHQEETPPEVRSLNPNVPPDLSAILVKLMAKDRDRRYQTPELLVRDLLTVAGALGLRSLSPEGLVWMSAAVRPSWERHLVWAIPTFALMSVVAFLIWMGQTPPSEPISGPTIGLESIVTPNSKSSEATPPKKSLTVVESPNIVHEPVPQPRDRNLAIKASEDLSMAVAGAASGTTLVLVDDGPYYLGPANSPPGSRRDLTIKAGPEVHPVLRPSRFAHLGTESAESALFRFGPGVVTIQDVEFQLDPSETDAPLSAIRSERTSLTVRRCVFRRTARSTSSRVSAVTSRSPSVAEDERPAPIFLDACHIDGGITGIAARGFADLQVRDTTIGADGPAFRLDNSREHGPIAVDLTLKHVSIRAGQTPVIVSTGTSLGVTVDESVIASGRDRGATLLATDDPSELVWRGRGNLYFGIETYLQVTKIASGWESIRSLASWTDDLKGLREVRSMEAISPVWANDGGFTPLSRNPTTSFALAIVERPTKQPGARVGPFGPIVSSAELVQNDTGANERATTPRAIIPANSAPPPIKPLSPMPIASIVDSQPVETPPAIAQSKTAEIPPMFRGDEPMPPPMDREVVIPAATDVPPPSQPHAKEVAVKLEPRPLRTRADVLDALGKPRSKASEFRLASDADVRLPMLELRGPGRWVLKADPGSTRPKLRFRPGPADPRKAKERPSLFRLRSGSLELEGIDVILESSEAPVDGSWAAFAVGSGTSLTLTRCTVTIEGPTSPSAMMTVIGSEEEIAEGFDLAEPSTAQIHVTDSFLRGSGDVIDVEAGRRLDLSLIQVVAGAAGALVHGHGVPKDQAAEPLKLFLEEITARVAGGLVYLESEPGSPSLPVAEIVARNSIFDTTSRESPLFRIDGQDDVDPLSDRIVWEGHGVVYHRIEDYRRNQTSRVGTVPVPMNRSGWQVFVGSKDKTAVHGNAQFAGEWTPERSLATLSSEDVRLAVDAPSAGPDLKRIPPVPASTSRPLTTGK